MIYHVSVAGNDCAAGTLEAPFRTINRAAAVAAPGDTVQVHSGEYREWVDPQQGGTGEDARITYEAAPGEKPVIKGSEIVTDWVHENGTVWKRVLPNSMFGDWNPFAEALDGDWFRLPADRPVHHGDVYINGVSMFEASSLADLYEAAPKNVLCTNNWRFVPEFVLHPEQTVYRWYAQVDADTTTLLCNFQEFDPNDNLIEINVRKCCFYPKKTGLNYITLRGFEIAHAACPFIPPTADQVAMVGPNWSKGWIIENNHLHDAKCSAISLGKEASTGHNFSRRFGKKSSYLYQLETVFAGVRSGWDKETVGSHIVRNNVIHDCGQTAIVGHMGCAFSRIEGNHIYNIAVKHEFWGDEIAGIKFHAAVDTQIMGNHIRNCTLGIWLDWQAQGTRVSRNLFHHNDRDLMIEVTHGPCTVDHNIFASEYTLDSFAQGTAYVHNLVAGLIRHRQVLERTTPYHVPHTTQIAGCAPVFGGDDRLINNLFMSHQADKGEEPKITGNFCAVYDAYNTPEEYAGLLPQARIRSSLDYYEVPQPVWIEGNAYSGFAKPYRGEKNAVYAHGMSASVEEHDGVWVLNLSVPGSVCEASCQEVTTQRLGKTRLTEQAYETPDGTPIDFTKDYAGVHRSGRIVPGPFAELEPGIRTITVWED